MIDLKQGPVLMGIVNVTPDSFSDGGNFLAPEKAVAQGLKLYREGAEILDIGGELTRPGAQKVSPEEELSRVLPVIEGLKDCGALLSVDTRNAGTMKAALAAGAGMVNDVSALTHDPAALDVVAEHEAFVCLMHMKGTPEHMQEAPAYKDVVQEVYDYLAGRIEICLTAGIARNRIVIDPGIGFGKTLEHNLKLLKNINKFQGLGAAVMLGASRKSFIEKLIPKTPVEERLAGSLTAALWGLRQGVQVFRVHDVAQTRQAFTVFQVISAKD